jgi:hypothetical protein
VQGPGSISSTAKNKKRKKEKEKKKHTSILIHSIY